MQVAAQRVRRRRLFLLALLVAAITLLALRPQAQTTYAFAEHPASGHLLWLAGQPVLAIDASPCRLAIGINSDHLPGLHHGDRILAEWCPGFPRQVQVIRNDRVVLDWRDGRTVNSEHE